MAITLLAGAKSSVGSSDCAGMNSVIASLANQQQQITTEQESIATETQPDNRQRCLEPSVLPFYLSVLVVPA